MMRDRCPIPCVTGHGRVYCRIWAMRQTLKQFRVFLESNPYTAGAAARISGRARAAIFLYRLSRSILAQWARDKCPQQAAALAFQTALSLVPVTAIVFSLLRAFGS